MTSTQTEKCRAFHALHQRPGAFVIPNPWDVGTALYLQSLGFKALATTSGGAAFSLGKHDGGVPLAAMLGHIRALALSTEVPVNADFESGHSADMRVMAANVRLCVEAGVAGLSIEDSTGDSARPLYEVAQAVERVRAARAAIDASGMPVVFTARAEAVLLGIEGGFEDALKRLVAFAEAGADCLYAPGLRTAEQVTTLVKAVAPKPVNVLVGAPGFTVRQLEDLGVRRISVGGALARCAWGGFMRAAKEIAEKGTFESFAEGAAYRDIDGFFRDLANG
ncbi:MAG: isocitrate lyase/phosphoenolpyruvate mutase family protein [Methylobacteriaceae bacterium]|nr:isocitrate lyase/phosphoenolpyruvate mutase family protein [Methylobacteriaceae bacterium]